MRPLLFAILALALSGCGGYKLGPTNGDPAGARSVSIRPFSNDTIEPRLIEYVSNSLRKQIQQDGTFRLETHGDGDLIVSGSIMEFHRSELSVQTTDVITPRDYNLVLIAHITAFNPITGKTNLSRNVTGRTSIRVGSDLSNSERQAIPLLADDLARNAVSLLANPVW